MENTTKAPGFWQQQWINLLFTIMASAIGFFIALYGNSRVDEQKDQATYLSMVKVIHDEAAHNKETILTYSLFKDPIHLLYPDLNNDASSKFLSDEAFLRYAPESLPNAMAYSNMG